MISIIIPVYNQTDRLSRCLDSILNQSYKDYEVIVVNDGSTDNINKITEKYKNKFQDSNIKFQIINQENKGSNYARNRGAMVAQEEFILFCDADLVLDEETLKEMINTLKNNPEASFVYSSFKYGLKTFKLWPYSAEKLKQMPYIHTTSLIRRKHFPGFDENIKRLQDWDLWLTMLENSHTGIWINKILFKIQGGGHTMSSWLPSFTYKLFPFLMSAKKYNQSVEIIKKKHNL